jgi:hypothetical protein
LNDVGNGLGEGVNEAMQDRDTTFNGYWCQYRTLIRNQKGNHKVSFFVALISMFD